MYWVEIGSLEVCVELVHYGDKAEGLEPEFYVSAGTDWEGNTNILTEEEEMLAIGHVKKRYEDEVYV